MSTDAVLGDEDRGLPRRIPDRGERRRQARDGVPDRSLRGERNGPLPGDRKVNIWAWRNQHAGVFYTATDTRNRDGPKAVLGDRHGRLQCDGHDCFSDLDPDRITRIGCWAHVRRYFEKARRSGDEKADPMLAWIGKLFAIEAFAKKGRDDRLLSDAELLELRCEQSAPVVVAIRTWLDQAKLEPPSLPGGPLMKGVTYALNQWPTLIRFLEDARIREISNNGCERALRNLVIGRNNWQLLRPWRRRSETVPASAVARAASKPAATGPVQAR